MNNFPVHERLTLRSIERELVGDNPRIELSGIIFNEFKHRIGLKLSIGERVALCCEDFSETDKQQLAQIASDHGAPVVEINEPDLDFLPAKPFFVDKLKSLWKGVTIIGDIHGDHKFLTNALAWARSRQHFAWLLGDIVDYGPEVLKVTTTVYHAVMHGEAALILGNHERKIARWLAQKNKKSHIKLNEGNRVTINALEKLSADERRQWVGQFQSLLAHSSLISRMDNITLVHAAIHPSLWSENPNDDAIEKFALFGEAENVDGKFKRSHKWIDHVPKGQTVFVGHDVLHFIPMVKTGAKGGEIVFLDTGCGKGGHLSSADLKFSDSGLHLECFKRY